MFLLLGKGQSLWAPCVLSLEVGDAFLPLRLFGEDLFCASCWCSPCQPCSWWERLDTAGAFLGRFGPPHHPAAGPPCGQGTSLEAGMPTGGATSLRPGDGLEYFLSSRTFYSSWGTFPCKLKWGNHSPNRQARGRIKKYPPKAARRYLH